LPSNKKYYTTSSQKHKPFLCSLTSVHSAAYLPPIAACFGW
jgi:hypothetical protein